MSTEAGGKKPLKSKKLDRTLEELECAFAAWDSITDQVPLKAPPELQKKAESANGKSQEQEFRAKTRKLLSQLRDQLADLSDD